MSVIVTAPPARSDVVEAPVRRRRRRRERHQLAGWLFVSPFVVVFAAFLLAPLGYALYLSLYTKGLATGTTFAGFKNYTRAFSDPSFRKGVWFVVRFSLVLIPVQMAVSLGAALALDTLVNRFAKASRLVIFLPYAIPRSSAR